MLISTVLALSIDFRTRPGFAFLEELTKLNLNLTGTKIVLLTSSQSQWDMERAVRSSAAALLHKPLTREKLLSVIE